MKKIISDTSMFEQINMEEGNRHSFFKKSGKKVLDLIKHKMRVQFQKKYAN